MEKLTYSQACDKIIQAYFKDEIKPMDSKFCFCGTLCGGGSWCTGFKKVEHNYSISEYVRMESALLTPLKKIGVEKSGRGRGSWYYSPLGELDRDERYEELLFSGMCAALGVLKNIHRERGEDVDSVPEFTKRELQKTNNL